MSFGDLRPYDAFLCGSIKYKPYFQLAMSSYDGQLTLSVNLYGSAGRSGSHPLFPRRDRGGIAQLNFVGDGLVADSLCTIRDRLTFIRLSLHFNWLPIHPAISRRGMTAILPPSLSTMRKRRASWPVGADV